MGVFDRVLAVDAKSSSQWTVSGQRRSSKDAIEVIMIKGYYVKVYTIYGLE